jgi:outer membrane protein OmpA-like peptidoglycan-associated protein
MKVSIKFSVLCLLITSLPALANVVGVDTQNFNPTTNGLDFVTVQSSETLEPGILNVGFFLNYAINSLPNYTDTTNQTRTSARDRLLSSDFNLGLGLTKNWDVGLSFPAVLNQTVDDGVFKGIFEKTGLTDIRLNTKYRLTGDKDGGAALIATLELPQVENNPFYGTSNSPTTNIEAAFDTTINKIALGFNLGYRFRKPGDPIPNVPIEPVGNMLIASVAGSYLFQDIDTKLISEIFTSFPSKGTNKQTDRELSSAELLVGVKHDLNSDLALHAGICTEISHGNFTPDWRIYAGLNWVMGPMWGSKEEAVVETVAQIVPPVIDSPPINNEVKEQAWLDLPAPLAPPVSEAVPMPTVSTDVESAQFPENVVPAKREVFIVKNLNFATGSNKIPLKFKEYLAKFSKYMNKAPYNRIVVNGHTDSIGKASTNLRLSRNRAQNVKRAMVEIYGMPASKIDVQGFGESRPIADNGNYQGRSRNRRVEFYVER